ncbi:MAG TPA: hypothetical protein PLK30_28675, partial [Blastocatellia bacterium]|nr:hypothetical protein [Blastocatellia bacterium]
LGAQRFDILKLIVVQGMRLVLIGLVAGLAASVALTRLISKLLFGVTATDLPTLAGISLLLSAIAIIACSLPARRATKIDPLQALRHE